MLSDFKASCFLGSMLQSLLASSFRFCKLPEERGPYSHLELYKNLLAVSLSAEEKGGIFGWLSVETGIFSGYILILTFCIWCQEENLLFPQTPLCSCRQRQNTESSSGFWFWSGVVGMLSWLLPSLELHGNTSRTAQVTWQSGIKIPCPFQDVKWSSL